MGEDDPKSFSNFQGYPVYNFGHEAWCNLEGRYIHVVADMNYKSTSPYSISICQIAAMGTVYKRDTPLPEEFLIDVSQT